MGRRGERDIKKERRGEGRNWGDNWAVLTGNGRGGEKKRNIKQETENKGASVSVCHA